MSLRFAGLLLLACGAAGPQDADRSPTRCDGIFEEFTRGRLDPDLWLLARSQWGDADKNGGVVPENVSIRDGKLVLEAHGDRYKGKVTGVVVRDRKVVPAESTKRVGAALVTRHYYASGRFEVRAKIVQRLGCCSAFWTYFYRHDRERPIAHEIDIEFPGRPAGEHRGMEFDRTLLNTWQGVGDEQHTIGYTRLARAMNDGKFHTYRFDWHTGGSGNTPRVEWHFDGEKIRTITTTVPFIAGRFWIGVWFPAGWAGDPDFEVETMEVDWVRITPFHEPNDDFRAESDPKWGFASAEQWPRGLK